MFYARIYASGATIIGVHASNLPITVDAIDPAGFDIYGVTFAGDYIASDTLTPLLSVSAGVVASTGPSIETQAKL